MEAGSCHSTSQLWAPWCKCFICKLVFSSGLWSKHLPKVVGARIAWALWSKLPEFAMPVISSCEGKHAIRRTTMDSDSNFCFTINRDLLPSSR